MTFAPAATTRATLSGLMPPSTSSSVARTAFVYRSAEAFHLRKHARNERLPAEAGVDRHDEHEVQLRQYLGKRGIGRRRVERDAGGRAEVAYLVDGAVQVRPRPPGAR